MTHKILYQPLITNTHKEGILTIIQREDITFASSNNLIKVIWDYMLHANLLDNTIIL